MIDDERDVAEYIKPVTDLVLALAHTQGKETNTWKYAREALSILWTCFEDCALPPNPRWTIKEGRGVK